MQAQSEGIKIIIVVILLLVILIVAVLFFTRGVIKSNAALDCLKQGGQCMPESSCLDKGMANTGFVCADTTPIQVCCKTPP